MGKTGPNDLGLPEGQPAGFVHPVVVVSAQRVLDAEPSVIHVVPLTTTLRRFHSEAVLQPDPDNGLQQASAAQCQHLRSAPATNPPAAGTGECVPHHVNRVSARHLAR